MGEPRFVFSNEQRFQIAIMCIHAIVLKLGCVLHVIMLDMFDCSSSAHMVCDLQGCSPGPSHTLTRKKRLDEKHSWMVANGRVEWVTVVASYILLLATLVLSFLWALWIGDFDEDYRKGISLLSMYLSHGASVHSTGG